MYNYYYFINKYTETDISTRIHTSSPSAYNHHHHPYMTPDNYPACPRNPVMTLAQVKDIKAALMGHRLLPNGSVDHSSPATTPWLQLHVVTYSSQLELLQQQPLIQDGVVDGISFWIAGSRQVCYILPIL